MPNKVMVQADSLRAELTRMHEAAVAGASRMTRDELIQEVAMLRQVLVDADEVTRARFEYYGLCDQIDARGSPYPSQFSADLIAKAKATVQASPCVRRHRG